TANGGGFPAVIAQTNVISLKILTDQFVTGIVDAGIFLLIKINIGRIWRKVLFMAATNILQTYLERCALITLEKQDKLESLIAESIHELDLDAGKIRFNDLAFPVQVLGTESDNSL